MSIRSSAGFTLIELMVVIGVLGLLLGIAIPSYFTLRQNVALGNNADEVVSALRLAQSNATASQGGKEWGVHFAANQYCIFSQDIGATPPPSDCSGQPSTTYTLGNYGISILVFTTVCTPITTPTNVIFKHLTGTVTAPQSIVVGISCSQLETIQVDATGKVSIL